MKKLLPILLLILSSTSVVAFSFKDLRSSLDSNIKAQAEANFSALFGRPVFIREAGGPVVGEIELNQVTIQGLGQVEKIVLKFNPLKYLYNKGDIIPALSKIIATNGELSVSRNNRGHWNLLPDKTTPGEGEPPPFRGELVLNNCQVNYSDNLGFRKEPSSFSVNALQVNGSIKLSGKNKGNFSLSANLPEATTIKGKFDLPKNKFEVSVSARKLNFTKWGNYCIPLPAFTALSGEADLVLKLLPNKIKNWPVSLFGNFSFSGCACQFQKYNINNITGQIFIADEKLAFRNINGSLNNSQFNLTGHFNNFTTPNLDLSLSLKNSNLSDLLSLSPQSPNIPLSGRVSGQVTIKGKLMGPKIAGLIKLESGLIYNQPLTGTFSFLLANNVLSAESNNLSLYQGAFPTKASLLIASPTPSLQLTTNFTKLNLATLAQNTPGIEGLADGQFVLSGPLDKLKGKINGVLTKAMILGQPLDKISSSFIFIDGELILENLQANSATASFLAQGKFDKNQIFDLQTEAHGFHLNGRGAFGPMSATLGNYRGWLSWKFSPAFFASPLKNIFVSGEAVLTDGHIGEQSFDVAKGKIKLDQGKLTIEDTFIKNALSTLAISGEAGLGTPTHLKLLGHNLQLKDLKVLNHLLPAEAKDPLGNISLSLELSGFLSKETEVASIDPFLDLTARGSLSLSKAAIADVLINQASLALLWKKPILSITNGQIDMPNSQLAFSWESQSDGTLKAGLDGYLDLPAFQRLTGKFGKLAGRVAFNILADGKLSNPSLLVSLTAIPIQFNNLYFDSITGSFNYSKNKLTLLEPLLIKQTKSLYALSGEATLAPEEPANSHLNLDFKVVEAELFEASQLFRNLYDEFMRRQPSEAQAKLIKISPASLTLPLQNFAQPNGTRLYSTDKNQAFLLKAWQNFYQGLEEKVTTLPEEKLGGLLTGNCSFNGSLKNLSGKLDANLHQGFYQAFSFDDLTLSATLKKQQLKINNAILTKGTGNLTARGNLDLSGQLFLHLVANNMPLNILQSLFPNKEFKGLFNMNAGLDGPLTNPKVSLAASGKAISLAGVEFDDLVISVTKKQNMIYLHELSLIHENILSKAYGSFSLDQSGQLDLETDFNGDAIGLLNLINNDIHWVKGQSAIVLKINGSYKKPKINGHIAVKDGIIHIKALDSDIINLTGDLSVESSLLQINNLTGLWSGKTTKGLPNPLGLAGSINLKNIFADKNRVDLNLAVSPTDLSLALPNLYNGNLWLKQLNIQGPFYFDLSQGPLLSGSAEVGNAVITIPSANQNNNQALPFNLDLSASLKKNVYVVMGDVATLNLSNIFMNLEVAGDGLKISGNLATPSLLGVVAIKRGTVNIFNREFTLLTSTDQKKFFPYDAEKIKENLATFKGEQGHEGALPDLNLSTSVVVENTEKDASGLPIKKEVVVLARLNGIMGASEQARGLKINLSGYTEDITKSPAEMVPTTYSEQDLKVMLLPDFIKSLTGVGQGQETSKVDTNTVVADYLSSRVQTILFRSLEREAEQKLGLESLTLEYNFGPSIREAMGSTDTRGYNAQKPAWSVGFVKGFFDRVYLDVRYAQGMEQTGGSSSKNVNTVQFNYQLTYKISPVWSIIYYQEPVAPNQITNGSQKVTLKAGFSLW